MPKTHRNQKSILNDGETPGFPVGRAMCEDFMEREGGLCLGGSPRLLLLPGTSACLWQFCKLRARSHYLPGLLAWTHW